jgi:two-component system, cell cycle sensor histidine kinase and response regulator CckA
MTIDRSIKILLVEDYPGDVLPIQETLVEMAFEAVEWEHVRQLKTAIDRLESADFDVILLDLVLPDSQGLDTYIQLQAKVPLIPIVVLTEISDETMALRILQAGAQDYLVKGQATANGLLLRSIRYAIERKHIQAQKC